MGLVKTGREIRGINAWVMQADRAEEIPRNTPITRNQKDQTGNLSRSNRLPVKHEGAHIPTEHFLFRVFRGTSPSRVQPWASSAASFLRRAQFWRRTGVLKQVSPGESPAGGIVFKGRRGPCLASRQSGRAAERRSPKAVSFAERRGKTHMRFPPHESAAISVCSIRCCPQICNAGPSMPSAGRVRPRHQPLMRCDFFQSSWSRLRVTTYFVALS